MRTTFYSMRTRFFGDMFRPAENQDETVFAVSGLRNTPFLKKSL